MSELQGSSTRHNPAGTAIVADHVAIWLDGANISDADPVSDDDRLCPDFSLTDWVDELRRGYPESVLTAAFRGGLASGPADDAAAHERAPWLDMARTAALVHRSQELRAFTGDTTPTSLRALRSWIANHLSASADRRYEASLVVSELSTNVERHSGGWLTVDLDGSGPEPIICVTDPHPSMLPRPRIVDPIQVGGRGLQVVASLSSWWGVVVRSDSKTIWAALGTPDG